MGYTANDIRNICLLGHGGDGKSALCESMLFTTKAITRLGKRADGTTVSDFDDEEKKRQYSISTSVIPVEYNKCKINVLDNPGYFDFAGQIVQSLRVSDAGIICLTAKSGIGVGTEKGWKYLAKAGLPAMFYISKLDEEHANFFNVFDSLREMFGASVIPFTFPILKGEQAVGLVDLIEKKAYDANGKEIPLPAEAEEKIEEYMAELNEQVAETDEALMEKFFMEEPFTEEELLTGIKAGIRDRSVTPVFCGCAYTGLGTTNLLSNLVKFAPNPLEGKAMAQVDEEGSTKEFKLDPKGSPMVFVFNTLADLLLQGHLRRRRGHHVLRERPHGRRRKARQHVLPEGQGQHQDLQDLLRRYRCFHEARLRQDRRHPGLSGQDRYHRSHEVRRAHVQDGDLRQGQGHRR